MEFVQLRAFRLNPSTGTSAGRWMNAGVRQELPVVRPPAEVCSTIYVQQP
jgi:hypothetical protein